MGGHGGLNILPQKSWNVYGRENRLKVARDEAKHEEEQRAKLEKQRLGESEARRAMLLQQAALKRLGTQATGSEEPAQLPAQEQPEAPALLKHVNFFEEHEARNAHPEVVEEARKEARRRGDPNTQTSDARFDERFRLGYGLGYGPGGGGGGSGAGAPWYAQAPSQLLAQDEALRIQDDGRPLALTNGHNGSSMQSAALLAEESGHNRQHKKRSKGDRKEKSKDKKSRKDSKREKSDKKQGLHIEKLRQERLLREKQERDRARQAIMGNVAAVEGGKRYNAAYGNAAVSRRT